MLDPYAHRESTVTDHIRRHALEWCGCHDPAPRLPDYSVLWEANWSPEFERMMRAHYRFDWKRGPGSRVYVPEEFFRHMRHRLVMGAIRYGRPGQGRLDGWDRRGAAYDMRRGLQAKGLAFQRTGNHEYLVDCANFCLLMFVFPHPGNPPEAWLALHASRYGLMWDPAKHHATDRDDSHHG